MSVKVRVLQGDGRMEERVVFHGTSMSIEVGPREIRFSTRLRGWSDFETEGKG